MVKILLLPLKTEDKEIIRHLQQKITEILGYKVVVRKEQTDLPKCRKRGVRLYVEDFFVL
jgi:hypothetical protein